MLCKLTVNANIQFNSIQFIQSNITICDVEITFLFISLTSPTVNANITMAVGYTNYDNIEQSKEFCTLKQPTFSHIFGPQTMLPYL